MDMHAYAIMIGFIGIGVVCISLVSTLLICPGEENIKKQSALSLVFSVLFIVITSIGFANWSSATDTCKSSPLGDVILAWCIIRIIGGCCGCVQGMMGLRGPQM